ncbi:uncharacterized protein PODANS_2_6360 [Podospora anserina S mat+]|uniref:Podospora anserina S mat+ genomic DNA chromosome 2, supercontig 2 n=1 Tax=Podospora anserina (strain S / ATCC MYA-4624 / DSM 980 / FGSC 10383) TaxID=515849 RepID=B2B609_PODAN|nr:uncharacterized protein PODANS_2_6360 [Podospora anserina S mat+]CAP73234.1 unnamed protein product [Podospora anserina S mat+]
METETARSPVGTLMPQTIYTQKALKLQARRIRKGTHSCWECKRRKIRCTFAAPGDAICIGCHRRDTDCRSQDLPEELSTPADRTRQMGDRIIRVETLIEQLVKKVGGDPSAVQALLKPAEASVVVKDDGSTGSESSHQFAIDTLLQEGLDLEDESLGVQRPNPAECLAKLRPDDGKHGRLSEALHSAYPSRQDLDTIYELGGNKAGLFALALTSADPASGLGGNSDPKVVFGIPPRDLHPVLVARHMLVLCLSLQYTHRNAYTDLPPDCETPRTIMRRLADTAIRLVTTNDEMLSSIESLHCILLEGLFQMNCGNLRRAWLAFRRAITVGQLMGIHRSYQHRPLRILDASMPVAPQHLFHRLVCADAVVSLMLGLPQGAMEAAVASRVHLPGDDAPVNKLERLQMGVAARILERNESDPSFHEYASTKALDLELQKMAGELPGRWWLPPSLIGAGNDVSEMLGRMWQLMRQVFHYNLLNQLHLPYMLLRSSKQSLDPSNSSYSRDTTSPFCCRAVDFYALMAAMTLLLAHPARSLPTPRSQHSRPPKAWRFRLGGGVSREHGTRSTKSMRMRLSEKSAGLIRRLMAIEADAANGRRKYDTQAVHRSSSESVTTPSRQNVLRVFIPYYGVVKIVATDEVISKEAVTSDAAGSATAVTGPDAPSSATLVPQSAFERQPSQTPNQEQQLYGNMVQSQQSSQNLFVGGPDFSSLPAQHGSGHLQPEHDSYLYPALTAGVDDWAFQGVDMAFFDSLMRSRDNTGAGLGPGYIRDPPTGYCDWETQ